MQQFLSSFTLRLRLCVVLLMMLMGCAVLLAQPRSLTKADSAVVRLELDTLSFPAGHQSFDTLYQHLLPSEASEARSLRVLHIGGSHVQAGVFSNRLRSNLQELFPDRPAGLGLMFPYSLLGSGGPKGYSFTSTGKWVKTRNVDKAPTQTMGLAGAAVTTSDLSSTLTLSHSRPFESLLVYGASISDTAYVYPVLIADGDTLYPPRSAEVDAYEFLFSHPVSECTLTLEGDSSGVFTFRGMVADPYEGGLLYTASGINGASVPSWLRCTAFQDELQPLAPDLAILAIGINDANGQNFQPEQFKDNYRQLIRRILQCNPHCALLFVTNNDCYLRVGRRKSYNKNTEKVEQAFYELAAEYHGAVWNLYQIMGGFKSSARWVKAGLMKSDHVHFSPHGYELLGDLLYNALLADYQKSWKF